MVEFQNFLMMEELEQTSSPVENRPPLSQCKVEASNITCKWEEVGIKV